MPKKLSSVDCAKLDALRFEFERDSSAAIKLIRERDPDLYLRLVGALSPHVVRKAIEDALIPRRGQLH